MIVDDRHNSNLLSECVIADRYDQLDGCFSIECGKLVIRKSAAAVAVPEATSITSAECN